MVESLDISAAHRHFAAHCFNAAWDILDNDDRTDEETETMIDLAHASRMHWGHRDDQSPKTRSISAWQISRVYAVADRPDEALRYGTEALDIARAGGTSDFYVAYGHEAVARAAAALGDRETSMMHLDAARSLLDGIDDADSRAVLAADLDNIPL
ncbi:MAG: hypothetical protein ABFR95_10595 [Actinomycetota bacterium]